MVKKSSIRFAQLLAFFEGMGFTATREKSGWRIEHAPSGTIFIFRPYRANDLVYAPDLFLFARNSTPAAWCPKMPLMNP